MMDDGKLLPVVSMDTISKLGSEAKIDKEVMTKTIDLLVKENPKIADFIAEFAKISNDPDLVTNVGLSVYNLLRSQAEADQLKKEFS